MEQFVQGFNQWNIVEFVKVIPLPPLPPIDGCLMRTYSEIVWVEPNYKLYIVLGMVVATGLLTLLWRARRIG